MKYLTLCLALTAALPLAFPAGADVLRQEDVLSAELRPGWREADGRQMAALHLQLAPHWKTYWRSPGEAGIPPEFDWSGSENLGEVIVHWPLPEVFEFQGMRTIGYMRDVVLPLEIRPANPSRPVLLKAAVTLGVCNDICMPAALALSRDLPMQGAPDGLIATALASKPLDAAEAGLSGLSCAVEPIADGLRVTARMTLPVHGAEETVVMEPTTPAWVSEAQVSRQGTALTAVAEVVPTPGTPFDLASDSLRLTVLAGGAAVEVTGCPVN